MGYTFLRLLIFDMTVKYRAIYETHKENLIFHNFIKHQWVLLTHFMPLASFYTPYKTSGNVWFQGVQKETSGMKWDNTWEKYMVSY